MVQQIPIFISPNDLKEHNLSNGQVAVAFFEAFLDQDITTPEEMREKVLRVGKMIQLISEAIHEYESEIQFFLDELDNDQSQSLCDAKFLQALNRIAMMQSFLKSVVKFEN